MKGIRPHAVSFDTLIGAHLTSSRASAALVISVVFLSLALLVTDALLGSAAANRADLAEPLATRLHFTLGWSAALAALATAVLSFARFLGRRDSASLIVGSTLALTFALESIHLLGRSVSLEPGRLDFVWLLTRSFTALALVAGIGTLTADREPTERVRTAVASLWIAGAIAIATSLILLSLPNRALMLELSSGSRLLFGSVPLLLFAGGLLFVFPRFHRARPTMFSFALILSAIPQLAYDAHHLLLGGPAGQASALADAQRLLAYAVLFLGLVWDYAQAHRSRHQTSRELQQARERLDHEVEASRSARMILEEERKERQRLEQSQKILQTAVETIRLGLTVTDLEGRIQYVNPAEAEMHGYRQKELLGKNARLYGLGEMNDIDSEPPPAKFWDRESVNQRKDGSKFPVRLVSDVVTDLAGSPIGLFTVCENLSEKEAVERTKRHFLASVSHELRTPLTSIVAALDLLENSKIVPETASRGELLNIAYRNSNRLLRLVDDLLVLQKLDAGQVEFRIEPVQVRPLVEMAMAEIRPQAEMRSVQLELRDETSGERARADADRLLQVLANLLSNAIKYSPQGRESRVVLTISLKVARICISVADEGAGIPEESLQGLFEPFSQVNAPSQQPGTGLGLSIVKRLMEGMGGSISIDSRQGRGTTLHAIFSAATEENVS